MKFVVGQNELLRAKNHHVVIRKRMKHKERRMQAEEFFNFKKQ